MLDSGRPELPTEEGAVGFVDSVVVAPIPALDDPGTWFESIVHRYPSEVFEIVDSPEGHALAGPAAASLRTFPSNARWADRFEMSATGLAGQYGSDLTPLSILRTDASLGVEQSVMMPVPVRSGNLVTWQPGDEPFRMPNPAWLLFTDVVLQNASTLIADKSLIVYEGSADPAHDFVAGQWQTVFGSAVNPELALVQPLEESDLVLPESVLLSGRNDSNWFHWLIEYLPRVLMLDPHLDDCIPLVVSSRVPPTGLEALRTLTNRPVVTISPFLAYRFTALHVLAPPVQILDTTKVPWSKGLRMNTDAIERLRDSWQTENRTEGLRRRIFLQRSSGHRSISNARRLARIASRHGLTVVDPGALSFEEQQDLFSSAEFVVGASGAVMANYIMLRPGSKILALIADQLFDFVLPAALAAVVGAKLTYLTGPSRARLNKFGDRNHWMHADYRISEKHFEQELLAALRMLPPAP